MLVTIHTFIHPLPTHLRHEAVPHFHSRTFLRLSTRYLKAGSRHCLPFGYVCSLVSKHDTQVLNAFYTVETVIGKVLEEAATHMRLPLTTNTNVLKSLMNFTRCCNFCAGTSKCSRLKIFVLSTFKTTALLVIEIRFSGMISTCFVYGGTLLWRPVYANPLLSEISAEISTPTIAYRVVCCCFCHKRLYQETSSGNLNTTLKVISRDRTSNMLLPRKQSYNKVSVLAGTLLH